MAKKKTTKKKTTKKKTAAKKGRPPGSKNKTPDTVMEVPAGCAVCHSTDLGVFPGSRMATRDIHGTLRPTGKRFTSIDIRRMQCRQCGAVTIVKTYNYDPDVWK